MQAAFTNTYGSPAVLELREAPAPALPDDHVLVQVRSAAVTAGDLRMRAADFPSITAVPGRLLVGVFSPRRPVQGSMFAGRVVRVGKAVTRFAVGDDVFGASLSGAYAELLAMPQGGALAKMPEGVGYEEAAATPYGAVTALTFLRDLGELQPGQKLLIIGAAGGVGRFAVQIGKHLGAEITAVCRPRSFELVRSLGADHVIDRDAGDLALEAARYDVIFDCVGALPFSRARRALQDRGIYLTLLTDANVLFWMAATALGGGQRAKTGVAADNARAIEEVRDLLGRGVIRPVVAETFPLERIADAHTFAETHRDRGAAIVTPVA